MRLSLSLSSSFVSLLFLLLATTATTFTTPTTKTSWDEYKHKNIDPSIEKVDHHSDNLHGPDVSKDTRTSSDKYWEEVSLEEKSRLRELNKKDPWWIGMKTSKKSWNDYTKAAIDPSIKKEDHHKQDLHGPDVSKDKRNEADQFWLRQLEEEKASLHKMNDPWKDSKEKRPSITTPLNQYQQLNLNQMTEEEDHHHQTIVSSSTKIDSDVRSKSDEFWLQSYLEEQSKLHEKHHDDKKEKESPYEMYTHKNLDGIMEKESDHHELGGVAATTKIDPNVRAKSDEFWLQSFLEEKSKLHNKNKNKASP